MTRTTTRTTRTATTRRAAAERRAASLSLAAVRAHASRAALAILNGDHDQATVDRFLALSKEADRRAAALA